MRARRLGVVAVLYGLVVAAASCGEREYDATLSESGRRALERWQDFHVPDPDRIPAGHATNPGAPWGDYVGSAACGRCHADEFARWRDSFHSRTLYDAVSETVFGDFETAKPIDIPGAPFLAVPYSVRGKDGKTRFFMKVRPRDAGAPDGADTYGAGLPTLLEGDFEIIHSFGNRRHQPYVARWPDRKHWVLPFFWNDDEKSWRYSGFRPYVESCAACHVTGIQHAPAPHSAGQLAFANTVPLVYNLPPDREGWAEGAVGCELCHGAGRRHVEAVERVGVERYREGLRAGTKERTIYDGKTDVETSTLSCDQCHDFFTESTISWVPGPKGYARRPWKEPIRPSWRGPIAPHAWPDDHFELSQFYRDGSRKSPCSIGSDYRESKMFHSGVKCTACHDPHGTRNWADLKLPTENNALCLSCHQKDFPTPEDEVRHSRHAAGSPGNRCVECHMPRHMVFSNGVEMMSKRIHRHDFSVPTGVRRPGGPPPSCNVCHAERDDAWTREMIRRMKEDVPWPSSAPR